MMLKFTEGAKLATCACLLLVKVQRLQMQASSRLQIDMCTPKCAHISSVLATVEMHVPCCIPQYSFFLY